MSVLWVKHGAKISFFFEMNDIIKLFMKNRLSFYTKMAKKLHRSATEIGLRCAYSCTAV